MTTDDRDNAPYRAAAELSSNEALAIASEIHRLDEASTLVGVLESLLDSARRVAGETHLFVAYGSGLRGWRAAKSDQLSSGQRFPLNVGGRVVAVLVASPHSASAAATLDVLTSYASRSLESMTLHKALGLIPPRIDPRSAHATVAAYLR